MATVRWTGNAQAIKQVQTITVSGTWALGDTATLTINEKDLTVTVGSDTSTSDIAEILGRAVNGTDDTPGLKNNESRNFNGQEIPEFTEVVASYSSNVLTLTSATAGVPFTVTRSENTAGSGALGAVTTVTAATGPNYLDNTDNWSTGSLPADGDTALFDQGSVSVLYGLTEWRTNTKKISLTKTTDYTGSIGAPAINALGYREYRTRRLQLYDGTGVVIVRLTKGVNTSTGSGSIYLDAASQTLSGLFVDPDAMTVSTTANTVEVVGGSWAGIYPASGSVVLGDTVDGTVTITTSLVVGRSGGTSTDCIVQLASTTLSDCEELVQRSGTCYYRSASTYSGGGTGLWHVKGGVGYIHAATRSLYLFDGTVYGVLGVPTTSYVYGGTLSMDQSLITGTGQKVFLHAGGSFVDPRDALADVQVYLVGCSPADVTWTPAPNKKYTLAAGATVS